MRSIVEPHSHVQVLTTLLILATLVGGCAPRVSQPVTTPPPSPPPTGVESTTTPETPLEGATRDAAEAYRTALDFFDQGLFSDAVSEAEKAVDLAPERAEHHLMLGRALSERIHQIPVFSKLPMARRLHDAFVRAVELDPKSVEGHTALARYYSEAPPVAGGDRTKAEHHARRLLELDPTAGHRMLAKLYTLWQEEEKAENHHGLAEELEADGGGGGRR